MMNLYDSWKIPYYIKDKLKRYINGFIIDK